MIRAEDDKITYVDLYVSNCAASRRETCGILTYRTDAWRRRSIWLAAAERDIRSEPFRHIAADTAAELKAFEESICW